MTTEEHITELMDQAKDDLGASDALGIAGYYAHSLFFAHLSLEKLCKSLWMKHKRSKDYPYTHNLSILLSEAKVNLTSEQKQFYIDMNLFQAKGRYPETIKKIENKIDQDVYNNFASKLKIEMAWLIKQLQ